LNYRHFIWAVLFFSVPAAGLTLSAEQLLSERLDWSVPDMTAFTPPGSATSATERFEGTLVLDVDRAQVTTRIHHDVYGRATRPELRLGDLPAFEFQFVQDGDRLLPMQPVPGHSKHPGWEYVLGSGRVWQAAGDRGYLRASLPFNLRERNADCMHNGVMSFLFKADGSISNAAVLIASETCRYFKFDLWAYLPARYLPGSVRGGEARIQMAAAERAARLEVRPITRLTKRYPEMDVAALANADEIPQADMSAYGLVIDGVHYLGGCATRRGTYPFCEELVLPSYSTAKSLFAGLALMGLERHFPGVSRRLITDYVPECSVGRWQDVRFVDALNMTTGIFGSQEFMADEKSSNMDQEFFLQESHAAKLEFGCSAYARRAATGERWVYNTGHTYVLVTAMNRFLKQEAGANQDIFADVVLPLWEPLGLSDIARRTRRSYDAAAQPWGGFGLMYLPGDIARLLYTLQTGVFSRKLDAALWRQASQGGERARGVAAVGDLYYSNGFWALDIGSRLGCETSRWMPFMSGYGGIEVALLPDGSSYYYFSDSGVHSWQPQARELHRHRPQC
jgi:hypothetical protein